MQNQFSETAPMTVQPSTLNSIATALQQRALSNPDRTVDQVLDETLEVVGRRVETLDKFQHPIKQDLDRIRVKITFKDKHAKLIPEEFDYRPKWDEKGQQLWHQQEAVLAGKENLAVVGRHREGKVDTGEPVFESNYPLRMGMLVCG
ncbi:MAG: hypothetical protein NUV54_00910, partial [Candidatus Taylorbacteria bacterium]|nr:hypothetical protein [Candidatus Taylorbacteria bacterium]